MLYIKVFYNYCLSLENKKPLFLIKIRGLFYFGSFVSVIPGSFVLKLDTCISELFYFLVEKSYVFNRNGS